MMLLSLATADLVNYGTVSMTNEDTDYPATNLQDYNPQNPAKATGTSTVITIPGPGGSHTPVAIGIHNHNLAGRTVTLAAVGGGGGSQVLTIPARSADGQCTNVFGDLRAVANMNGTSHTLTITGGSGAVAIGRICLVTAVIEARFIVPDASFEVAWPQSHEQTMMLVDLDYDKGIRIRKAAGITRRATDRASLYSVIEAAKGSNIPFFMVPDDDVNDCWYAKASTGMQWSHLSSIVQETATFEIRELSMGLVL